MTARIQVVCEDAASFLGSRNRERTNTSEDVCNDIFRFEQMHETFMLRVKPRVPIHLREVKDEPAIRFMLQSF